MSFNDCIIIGYMVVFAIVFTFAMLNLGGNKYYRFIVACVLASFWPLPVGIGLMLFVESLFHKYVKRFFKS